MQLVFLSSIEAVVICGTSTNAADESKTAWPTKI